MFYARYLILSMTLAACTQAPTAEDSSKLRIDSGWFVGDGGAGDAQVGAVYQIAMANPQGEGLCTGTAVSDNTLVAAGHCIINISEGGQRAARVCLTNGVQRPTRICSTTLLVPPSWEQTGDFRQDVSVVIFPHGTFTHFIPLRTQSLSEGVTVVLVGFSDANLEVNNKGMKRWGENTIDSFDSDNAINTTYGGDGMNVAVSPGDSGGPLLAQCQLAGVASREAHGNNGKSSIHTNLTDPVNASWLNSLRAQGAEFCGLPGATAQSCPLTSLAAMRQGGTAPNQNGQPLFPCTDSTDVSSSNSQLYVLLDESGLLHVSAPDQTTSVQVCTGTNAASCNGSASSHTVERTLPGRSVFPVALSTLAPGSDNFFVVSALDKTGAATGKVVVEIH